MTSSRRSQINSRRRSIAKRSVIIDDLEAILLSIRDSYPPAEKVGTKYASDPVGFCRDVLGIEPWHRQRDILESIRDNQRVAVVSGHKIGKSIMIAACALWYYDSHPDARVVLTSTTSRQVDHILWREIMMLTQRSGRCVACKAEYAAMIERGVSQFVADAQIPRPCPHSHVVDGELSALARTGMKNGFSTISGFTAREAEAVAGISGKNLLFLADEASGITDKIFEAIEGNRAGGARLAMFSNGTRTSGYFFDAFHSKKSYFSTHQISSEETPNYKQGKVVVPGLATRDYIEEKRAEWGEDSAQFIVRIKGGFPVGEDGKIFSLHAIAESQKRWHEDPGEGRLFIGVDPAGESGMGDDSAFCVRRGSKAIAITVHRGLSPDDHLAEVLRLIEEHGEPREKPVVVLDREGPIGHECNGRFRSYIARHPGAYDYVGVKASERARRDAEIYDRLRDVLAANLSRWLRDGGSIPEDVALESELHALEWSTLASGRSKVTPKETLRKVLKRSPDRYDALALACWEPRWLMDGADDEVNAQAIENAKESRPARPRLRDDDLDYAETTYDVYSAGRAFGR